MNQSGNGSDISLDKWILGGEHLRILLSDRLRRRRQVGDCSSVARIGQRQLSDKNWTGALWHITDTHMVWLC